ncbi:hypothetical protein CSC3H3_16880 [Thalassospira marina]|uniref:Uncharacterized protein n=1 Tax=Thalassospira marina TaxID=2048283 RepID=A0ABM6QCA9_9PROT|nr:hypothetical protein CSC3H3_16880 [Thalassospira marina]
MRITRARKRAALPVDQAELGAQRHFARRINCGKRIRSVFAGLILSFCFENAQLPHYRLCPARPNR